MVRIFVISRLNGTKELIISIVPSYPLTNERERQRDRERQRETKNTNLSQEKSISRVGGTLTGCRMLMDD